MVERGEHHNQAVCACATQLLDRVLAVLRTDQPYELRDLEGTPVSVPQARAIVLEQYQAPAEVDGARRGGNGSSGRTSGRNNHRKGKAASAR